MTRRSYPFPPAQQQTDWYRDIYNFSAGVMKGQINSITTVTLGAGVTTTTLTDAVTLLCAHENVVPLLTPTTANAAGALATTYVSTRAKGSITLTHANAGTTDRIFLVVYLG